MTRSDRIQDALHRGLGVAARGLGAWCDAFRPRSGTDPLDSTNRFLRLPASFLPQRETQDVSHGHRVWQGVFDAAYTRPGDYLSDGEHVFFVVAQEPFQPVLCIGGNRVVSVRRPGAPAAAGVNGYGRALWRDATPLLTRWPASVVTSGQTPDRTDLPADAGLAGWSVWLPLAPIAVVRTGDLLQDDLGRNGVVSAADISALGWRLTVKQAAN
jgi:hypothetical protein